MTTFSAEIHIDFSIIKEDISLLKNQISNTTKFLAVIKADAYGHTLGSFVKNLDGYINGFAVVRIEEALEIRKISSQPILLMQGIYTDEEAEIAKKNNFTCVIHNINQLEIYKNHLLHKSVWIKLNTGMNRLGFVDSELDHLSEFLNRDNVLMTHLASAEDPNNPSNYKQIELFNNIHSLYPHLKRSILNSAGVMHFPEHSYEWVRCGIGMYGGLPAFPLLKTAVRFRSKVIGIRKLKQGDAVGYGGRVTAKSDKTIALVYCGYADGFPQSALDGTKVMINHQEATIYGQVSMDLLTIDISKCQNIRFGDWCDFWSPELSINENALFNNLISYELMNRVDPRVKRVIYENN